MTHRLSRSGLLLALCATLLPPAAQAQAPKRDRTALHPCVLTGARTRAERENLAELEAVCATAAVRESMNLVPSPDVRAFLDSEARGSCAKVKNRNACLGRLAAATQAAGTLYITLNPFSPKSTRITGLVVNGSGKSVEERTLELPRLATQSPRDVIRYAVPQLLDQLEVGKAPLPEAIPLSLTGEPEPEPVAQQPPPPAPTVVPDPSPALTAQAELPHQRTWKTPAGITGLAVGAVGLGVAGFFVASSNSDAKEFNNAYDGKFPPQSELTRFDALRDDVNSQRTLATISASVGGAFAVGGLVLLMLDHPTTRPEADKAGTARLLAGPNHVGLRVILP